MGKGKIRRMRKKSGGKGSQIPAANPSVEVAKTASGREINETIPQPISLPSPQDIDQSDDKLKAISQASSHANKQPTSQPTKKILSYQTSNQDFGELRSQLLYDIRKQNVKDVELTPSESASHQPIKQTSSTGNRFDLNQNENVNQIKNQLLSQIKNQDAKCKHDFNFIQDTAHVSNQGKGRGKQTSSTVKLKYQNVNQIKNQLLSQIRNEDVKQNIDKDTTPDPSREIISKEISREETSNQQDKPISKCTKKASNISNVRDQMLNQIENQPERNEHNFESVEPTLIQPLAQPETISPNLLLTSNQHFSQHTAPLPVGPIAPKELSERHGQSELIQHFIVQQKEGAPTEIYFKGSGFNGSSGDESDEEQGLLEEDVSSSEASTIVVSEENEDKSDKAEKKTEVATIRDAMMSPTWSSSNESSTNSNHESCAKCPPDLPEKPTEHRRLTSCRSCPAESPKETKPRVNCTRDICSPPPREMFSPPPPEVDSPSPRDACSPVPVDPPLEIGAPPPHILSIFAQLPPEICSTIPRDVGRSPSPTTESVTGVCERVSFPVPVETPVLPEFCSPPATTEAEPDENSQSPRAASPPQVVSPLPFWQTMSFKDAVVLDTSCIAPRTSQLQDTSPPTQQKTEFQHGLPITPSIPAFQEGRRVSPALPPPPTELELYGHDYDEDETKGDVTLPLQVESCEWGTTFSAPVDADIHISFDDEASPQSPQSFSDELDEAMHQAGLTELKEEHYPPLVDYIVTDKLSVAKLVEIFNKGCTASLDIEELCRQVVEGTQSVVDEHVPSDLVEECASLASSADDIMTVLEGEGEEVHMEDISAVVPDKSWTSLGGEGSVQ